MGVRWAKRVAGSAGLEAARREGFRCVRFPVGAIMGGDEASFPREKERLLAEGVSFEVFDSPLPDEVQVTERGFNLYSWTEYLTTALSRIAELGCKFLVWGDGRSRRLPLEGETAPLKEQFHQFLFLLCGLGERHGVTICLEPLGGRRTNFLNTPGEIVDCFSLLGKRNLALAVGLRDLYELQLDSSVLKDYGDKLAHLQIENPTQPLAAVSPRPSDGWDYSPFFRTLRDLNYAGVVSLPQDADAAALAYCDKLLREAGRS